MKIGLYLLIKGNKQIKNEKKRLSNGKEPGKITATISRQLASPGRQFMIKKRIIWRTYLGKTDRMKKAKSRHQRGDRKQAERTNRFSVMGRPIFDANQKSRTRVTTVD